MTRSKKVAAEKILIRDTGKGSIETRDPIWPLLVSLMLYPWYLPSSLPKRLVDEVNRVQSLCSNSATDCRLSSIDVCSTIHTYLESVGRRIHPSLVAYLRSFCEELSSDPERYKHRVMASELLSAMQYPTKAHRVGVMTRSDSSLRSLPECESRRVKDHISGKVKELVRRYDGRDGNLWFHMRVVCMDLFSIASCLSSKRDLVLYYAGAAHTKAVHSYFASHPCWKADVVPRDEALLSRYMLFSSSFVKRCHCGRRGCCSSKDGKRLVLLGEVHDLTKPSFHGEMRRYQSKHCSSPTTREVLVEKHRFQKKDILQQELACNMKEGVTLHKVRCDRTLVDNTTCSSILWNACDNRHEDMGFLRVEVFDGATRGSDLEAKSMALQREGSTSFLAYLST